MYLPPQLSLSLEMGSRWATFQSLIQTHWSQWKFFFFSLISKGSGSGLYHFAARCLAADSVSEMPIAIRKAARRLIFLLLLLFPQNESRSLSSLEAIKPSPFDHWGVWMFKRRLLPNSKVLHQPNSYWLQQDSASTRLKESSIFVGFKDGTTFQDDIRTTGRNHPGNWAWIAAPLLPAVSSCTSRCPGLTKEEKPWVLFQASPRLSCTSINKLSGLAFYSAWFKPSFDGDQLKSFALS